MSYKTILVYIDSPESASNLVSAAAKVAERSEAHLIGMYVIPPVPVYIAGELPAPVMLNNYHTEQHESIAQKIKNVFEEITSNRALVAEWRVIDAVASVTSAISAEANTADCLMVGAGGAGKLPGHGLSEDHLSKIISATPRPVLIVPVDHQVDSIATNIMVGWDNSEESCRAVFDSLPLLKAADSVNLLNINPTSDERHNALGSSSELTNTLARHNVNANLSFSSCGIGEIGDELLRASVESGSDLLVMGAYGHRVRDFFMGSVTRKVLKGTKVPVLVSR